MNRCQRLLASVAGLSVAASALVVAGTTSAGAAPPRTPETLGAATPAASTAGPGFHAVNPQRVLDTRVTRPFGPGESRDVPLGGVSGVPDSGVAAVVLNLTAVAPTAGGFLTVYPAGSTRPTASTLNFAAGQTVANEVIAAVQTGVNVSIFNSAGSTNVLVDVTGWFATGSYYNPMTPTRVLDTRIGVGAPATPVGPGQSIDVQITGQGGVPATGATAVAVNITGTAPTADTYITAYPTGQPRPTTSNLNLARGQTGAVLAVAELGTGGQLSLYNNSGATELVADVSGWFSTTGQFTPITPTRLLDTRKTGGAVGPGEARVIDFGDSVPTDAGAAVLSVTAVEPTGDGYLTVQANEPTQPINSVLNFTTGHIVANLVIPAIHPNTSFTVVGNHSGGSVQIVVDLLGWFLDIPTLTNTLLPDATVPAPYDGTLTAAGGTGPYTWSVTSGSLPAGLSLSSSGGLTATISGTPTGTSSFTIRITDANGGFDERMTTLVVQPYVPGAVWAWGDNQSGALGNGNTVDNPVPGRIDGLSGMLAIASGFFTGYALKSDNTVWAWGANGSGQVGDGTTTNRLTPVRVSGLTNVVAIAGGAQTGYALKADGTVWAWGDNSSGQLGNGTTANSLTPVRVSGLTGITAIAGGFGSGYALRFDGTVWAWGDNESGQLGDGTILDRFTPVQVTGLTGILALAAGSDTGYALRNDSTVWAWGANDFGELGDGTNTDSSTPVQVTGLTGVFALAGGAGSGFALKSDGTLWAWGANGIGQLGDGTTTDTSTPVQVTSLAHVTDVASGFGTSFAVTSDGAAWAWGLGTSGQLGGATGTDFVPHKIPRLPPVTAMAAGDATGYALGTP